MEAKSSELVAVCRDLVDTINATGGLTPVDDSLCGYAPVGDPEWIDLAYVYLKACRAIGTKPVIAESECEPSS